MRLFEYQGKALLRGYSIPVPPSVLVRSLSEVDAALDRIGLPVAVKSQVLAGGRWKAGGVAIAATREEAREAIARIMQLEISGETPDAVLLERVVPASEEMYVSVSLDRGRRSFVAIAARSGGVEVESLEGKVIEPIAIGGLTREAATSVASRLNLGEVAESQFAEVLLGLERLCREKECELVEVNPLAVTDGEMVALDAKVILDDNALFRHPEFSQLPPEDPLEGVASKAGFSFVRLEGDLAVIGNGAGLVLSTLDMVSDAGGRPACFLDLGGGSQRERVEAALRVVRTLPNAKKVLVNIFGGITRASDVAEGLLNVIGEGGMPPVFARLSGAEEERARSLLEGSPVKLYQSAPEAVRAAVDLP